MSLVIVPEISQLHWEVVLVGAKYHLVGKGSEGEYVLDSLQNTKRAAACLDPVVINQVLNGSNEDSRCTCATTVGRPRCQHKFTFGEVRQFRGAWLTSSDPVADAVHFLTPQSQGRRKVEYYLGSHRVCRGFYQHCMGMSDRLINTISKRVCGKPVTTTLSLTPMTYKTTATQLDSCVAFWQYFFGSYCQTSDGESRYFPINLSGLHIYHQMYWPWWQKMTGKWQERQPLPVGAI